MWIIDINPAYAISHTECDRFKSYVKLMIAIHQYLNINVIKDSTICQQRFSQLTMKQVQGAHQILRECDNCTSNAIKHMIIKYTRLYFAEGTAQNVNRQWEIFWCIFVGKIV